MINQKALVRRRTLEIFGYRQNNSLLDYIWSAFDDSTAAGSILIPNFLYFLIFLHNWESLTAAWHLAVFLIKFWLEPRKLKTDFNMKSLYRMAPKEFKPTMQQPFKKNSSCRLKLRLTETNMFWINIALLCSASKILIFLIY